MLRNASFKTRLSDHQPFKLRTMNPSPAFGIYFPFWKLSIDEDKPE
jgi:hypothetical protein